MDGLLTVRLQEPDGNFIDQEMTEWEARNLLADLDIPQPPVMCSSHERIEISTARL